MSPWEEEGEWLMNLMVLFSLPYAWPSSARGVNEIGRQPMAKHPSDSDDSFTADTL